ncbi:hypothetical protein BKA70DRAFT_1439234 [Coprinopsis sp. MPI-PUGE-AT-0042]|nr:hypothetical protein BKA70DRAFT_1439234 [Coprinopsis sp. MPI-PUGE-AT-0042]
MGRSSTGYCDNGWNQKENEAVIKRLKELKESWVSSNTASRTWRQAGAAKYQALAIGAETERNPFALVVAIVNPLLDNARSMLAPMKIYTARGALMQPFTISGRAKGQLRACYGTSVWLGTSRLSSLRSKGGGLRSSEREVSFGARRKDPCAHR